MKKTLEIKLKAFATADKFLEENKDVWQKIAGIAANRERYRTLKIKIDAMSLSQKSGSNGNAAATKKEMRKALIKQTMMVVRAYRAAAVNTEDQQMQLQLNFTESGLRRIREAELGDTALMVYNTASPKAEPMNVFIDRDQIDQLKVKAQAFKDFMVEPRLETSKESVTTVSIEDLTQEMTVVFNNINDMVAPFQDTNPVFYLGFSNSRKQVGMSSRKRGKNNGNNGSNDSTSN